MTDLGSWDPIDVGSLPALLADVAAPWWLAGGYAVVGAGARPARSRRP